MKIQCGIDIIEIDRIKKSIETKNFIEKIFTKKEIEYCESKNENKYQHYAGRFAGKEAIFKAINQELQNKYDISWQDVEIINSKNGKPEVKFITKQISTIQQIDISISHCKQYATAMVIVEINGE